MKSLDSDVKVMIVGAGRSGIACARFLSENGNRVLLCDTKKYEDLVLDGFGIEGTQNLTGVTSVFGRQPSRDEVSRCGLLIVSPGVPPDATPVVTADELGIKTLSEIEFAASYFKGHIVAVTGTNGKTTTTSLTGAILKEDGREAYTGGNIGDPFINYAQGASEDSYIALEISSFQLMLNEKLHPDVAVITNITPDHLDRHKTMENYIAAKAKIFSNMRQSDLVILNADDPIVCGFKDSIICRVQFFTTQDNPNADAYLSGDSIIMKVYGKPQKLIDKTQMHLMGNHNAANVMCAALAAAECGVPLESIRAALKKFMPVEHRVEFVTKKNGVAFINDSKGTNPDATMIAVCAMEAPTVLILGGYDKNSSFDELFTVIRDKVKCVVTLGQTKDKLHAAATRCGYQAIKTADTFDAAVRMAAQLAQNGDCVLLSPACASWDMFDNFETRGRVFKEIVRSL